MATKNTVEMVEVELWVLVNVEGEYTIGRDQCEAEENYSDGGYSGAHRLVRVVLDVPKPHPITLRGTVPQEASDGGELIVVE